MFHNNHTEVNEIFLFGLQNFHSFGKAVFFTLILIIYSFTVSENVLITVLVSITRKLQSPMYIFLQQLSISDILNTTNVVPIMLKTIIYEGVRMSLVGCMTQLYFSASLLGSQCILLSIMSFDRYLAICNPLYYVCIMNQRLCFRLILMSWMLAFSISVMTVKALCTLQFCKRNSIHHFFCDLEPLLQLSCSDTKLVRVEIFLLGFPVIIPPLVIIMASYISIAHAIMKITSITGKQKAFSTCSSHLTVVCLFYGTLIGIYLVPNRGQLLAINKAISLMYTVAIPFLNPIIYSLRCKDLKSSLAIFLHIWQTPI